MLYFDLTTDNSSLIAYRAIFDYFSLTTSVDKFLSNVNVDFLYTCGILSSLMIIISSTFKVSDADLVAMISVLYSIDHVI